MGVRVLALLDTRSFGGIVAATTVGLVLHAAMYGPQAAFFSELFGTRVRYSGVSVGYQLASVFAGGLAPFIAVALLAAFDSPIPVAIYVVAGAVLTVIAVLAAKETRYRDLVALKDVDRPVSARALTPDRADTGQGGAVSIRTLTVLVAVPLPWSATDRACQGRSGRS